MHLKVFLLVLLAFIIATSGFMGTMLLLSSIHFMVFAQEYSDKMKEVVVDNDIMQ